MKIIGLGQLHNFIQQYPDTKKWLENWIADVKSAQWNTPHDIKKRYSTASFLAGNCVIFNVRGNNYRLEITVAYQTGIVIVEWIGTHADYSKKSRAAAK